MFVFVLVCLVVVATALGAGENLCVNGGFDDNGDPLAGWNYDYQWWGNEHYMQNHTRVSVVSGEGLKRDVLRINAPPESKVESKPIVFEKDARYRCTLDVRGGPARIYFAGYKWKPGVRPHADPHLGELRKIYKSKPFTGSPRSWQTVSFEFPLKNLSGLGRKHLKYIRFISVYIWANGEVFVDNVKVTKIK